MVRPAAVSFHAEGETVTRNALADRAAGCLAGAAVGDALGGATEGSEASEIVELYGGFVTGIVQSMRHIKGTVKPFSPFHKGDGHVTDDTLMTHALVEVYAAKRDRLTAFDIDERLVPRLIEEKVWVPELERDELLYHRIFLAEKWLVLRLKYAHADPREAGVGNIVNCGAAMYIAPVGLANACDPDAAYAEALDVAGAHQWSYGREAAAVLAAAVAEAMRPGATVDSIVEVCLRLAHDGTRAAIAAVVDAASSLSDWTTALAPLRAAFAPFDSVGPRYAEPGLGARVPSRLHSIEELPIALGLLVVTQGNYEETVLGGVNYGRDSDSIASMGGGLAGALGGVSALRRDWLDEISAASRIDLEAPGRTMADVAVAILERDAERFTRRSHAVAALVANEVSATA
jgi:ADP-ribosylglycohydrolase